MSELANLPLFPLGVVLYPGIPLDLQIFEERYMELVKTSLRNQSPFAIVPITDGREVGPTPEIFSWGTLVSIIDWSQRDNGLLGITVSGKQRVKIGDTHVASDKLLLANTAQVQPIEESIPVDEENLDLLNFLNDLIEQMGGKTRHSVDSLKLNDLVWQLAYMLPLEHQDKCRILTYDDPRERTLFLKQLLWRMSHKK